MNHLLFTTIFALAAAMDICPAAEEVCRPLTCEPPAALKSWEHKFVQTADGARECRIRVAVRATEGQVPDISKFSVKAEWSATLPPDWMSRDDREWTLQEHVRLDASSLRWQKENPDWADGVEWFEISLPVAGQEAREEVPYSDLFVELYYDGRSISDLGDGLKDGGAAYD